MKNNIFIFTLLVLFASPFAVTNAQQNAANTPQEIRSVLIHPPVAAEFNCSEHAVGQQPQPGNALGSDCVVVRYNAGPEGRFPSNYSGDGSENKDWYSWEEPLLAPFKAIVKLTHINQTTNTPGKRGEGRASGILFERLGSEKHVQVLYAHVRDIKVARGDTVSAGDVVARIGNNGYSWFPHVHIGAVEGGLMKLLKQEIKPSDITALQLRFDLKAMGKLTEE